MTDHTQSAAAGRQGESLACLYLRAQGYTVLERNWKAPREYGKGVGGGNELDLVALKDDTLIFVEVKTRRLRWTEAYGSPAHAVNREKKRRIMRAASYYLRTNPPGRFARYDIIEVLTAPDSTGALAAQVTWIPGAFRADGPCFAGA